MTAQRFESIATPQSIAISATNLSNRETGIIAGDRLPSNQGQRHVLPCSSPSVETPRTPSLASRPGEYPAHPGSSHAGLRHRPSPIAMSCGGGCNPLTCRGTAPEAPVSIRRSSCHRPHPLRRTQTRRRVRIAPDCSLTRALTSEVAQTTAQSSRSHSPLRAVARMNPDRGQMHITWQRAIGRRDIQTPTACP